MNAVAFQEAIVFAERSKGASEKVKTSSPRESTSPISYKEGRRPGSYIELVTWVPICGLEFARNADEEDGASFEW